MRDERSLGGLWIFWLIVAGLVLGIVGVGYWVVAEYGSLSDRSGFICVIGLSLFAGVLAILAIARTVLGRIDLLDLRDDTEKFIRKQLNGSNIDNHVFSKRNAGEIQAEMHRHREQITQLNTQIEHLRRALDRSIRQSDDRYIEQQSQREARQGLGYPTQGSMPGAISKEDGIPFQRSPAWEFSVGNRDLDALQGATSSFGSSTPSPAKVYFVSVPEEDGSFKDLKDREEYDALYKLTLNGSAEQATSATVDLCLNSDGIKAAIQLPNRYLSPVCVYDASPFTGVSSIIQEHSGRAERVGPGQRWKIKDNEKLKISFR